MSKVSTKLICTSGLWLNGIKLSSERVCLRRENIWDPTLKYEMGSSCCLEFASLLPWVETCAVNDDG